MSYRKLILSNGKAFLYNGFFKGNRIQHTHQLCLLPTKFKWEIGERIFVTN